MPRQLRAALITPLSGPLRDYGRAGAEALALWADHAADLPPGYRAVELICIDAHPDAHAAARQAVARRPDALFGPYGTAPAVVVARATGRCVWNHGAAWSGLSGPGFRHVVNIPAPASTYFHGALRAVHAHDPAARSVTVVHADTRFARDVAQGAAVLAERLRLYPRLVPFPVGAAPARPDAVPPADLLLVAAGFADEVAMARALLGSPGRWRAAGFVGAGVEEVLAELGDGRNGLLGPAQWMPAVAAAVDEGPSAGWFVAHYRARTGREPPYPAAQAFASGVLVARCLRDVADAGQQVTDESLLRHASALRCTTMFGQFAVDPSSGLQVGHTVVTVQWQDGRRVSVWPPQLAAAPLRYPVTQ